MRLNKQTKSSAPAPHKLNGLVHFKTVFMLHTHWVLWGGSSLFSHSGKNNMIQDGALAHHLPENVLQFWRPSSPVLYGLLVAFLTTLLSYQATALIFDLCMGIKRSGTSAVSDIATTLLVRSFSPSAVLYSLFPTLKALPTDANQRKPDKSHIPLNTLRVPVLLKLAFLLTIVPVINIVTVLFNLETTTWLTFADARFGGLAFGVNPSLATHPVLRTSINCTRALFPERDGEDIMVMFLHCEFGTIQEQATRTDWFISVLDKSQKFLEVVVHSPVHSVVSAHTAHLLVRGLGLEDANDERNGIFASYTLRMDATNKSVEMLVDFGLQMVKEICQNETGTQEFDIVTFPYPLELAEGRAMARKSIRCASTDPNEPKTGGAVTILEELGRRITFIESPRLDVAESLDAAEQTFISGQDLLLLQQRRSYVSVPILGILTSVVVVLRVLSGFLTSNDLERGIGLIIRQGLGLRCCDSMLASPHVVANYGDESEVIRYRSDTCADQHVEANK